MELEFHQLKLRYDRLRIARPDHERRLLSSLAEVGQQVPIVMVKDGRDDHFVVIDGYLINTQLRRIIDAIAASKLPAIFGRVEDVEAGALMAYSGSTLENFRRSASYVDRILKGAKPGELAIEQPSKFELAVNLKTAKAIGITLPTSLLVRADRVIQ